MCYDVATYVATGLSSIINIYGSHASARARNAEADYNAQVARNNAQIARQEGQYAKGQALRNAKEKRKETATLIGAQRARQGASGVVVDSGSAMDVVLNTAEHGEREAIAMLQEGDVAAWRAENQARSYEQQSAFAENSKVSVASAVGGSLLSSASSAAMTYASLGGFSINPTDGETGDKKTAK